MNARFPRGWISPFARRGRLFRARNDLRGKAERLRRAERNMKRRRSGLPGFPIAAPGLVLVRRGRKGGSGTAYYNVGNVGNAGSAGKCRDRVYRRAATGRRLPWTATMRTDPAVIQHGYNITRQ